MPNASKIIHLPAYGIYLACTGVARLLPLKLVFVVGQGLGLLGYLLLFRRRRVAIWNIMLALDKPEPDARALARRHFMNLGANMLSALKIATMHNDEISKCVSVDVPPDLEEIAKQTAGKQGWVAMISHMGNWEVFSHLSPIFPYYKYGAIYHRLSNPLIDRHFKESRARSGVTLFDRREGYYRCADFLKSGGALGVLVDQYAGMPGTWMPFFKRLTSTSTLAAALAMRAKTMVVPVSMKTVGLARWHVSISHPIHESESQEILTARINTELERQIKASPEDWLWSHNRWKTPKWVFLFSRAGQKIFFPPDFDRDTLLPYRVLIRSVDTIEEARESLPAVRAIKNGRPDNHVTMLTPSTLADFWREANIADELIIIKPGESVWSVGKKIKSQPLFDVGILLPDSARAGFEAFLGGVPYRVGAPKRFLLNNWANPTGVGDPPKAGAERYRRIADAAGAKME